MTEAETRAPTAKELVRQWILEAGEEEFSVWELYRRLVAMGFNPGNPEGIEFKSGIFWEVRESLLKEKRTSHGRASQRAKGTRR